MKNYQASLILISFIGIVFWGCNLSDTNTSSISATGNNSVRNLFFYNSSTIKNQEALQSFDKGLKLVEENNFDEAYKYLIMANKIEPNNPTILDGIGNFHANIEAFDSAIYYYKLSLKLDSSYINTYVDYGCTLNEAYRYEEAIAISSKGLKANHDSTSKYALYINIAASYSDLKKCDEMKKYIDTALLLIQNEPDEVKKNVIGYSKKLLEHCN